MFNKIDFNSLFTDDCSHFHGDFILDNIIKTKESYKLLDWRQDFAGIDVGDVFFDLGKMFGGILMSYDLMKDDT